MTAGTTPKQADLWAGTAAVCEGRVGEQSIWAVLYREGDRLFGDELFADLFAEVGRRSVPPRIVATVMPLQRLQGLSDREAVEAFCFDARWKYACGGLAFDYPGFSHTVLVDMRAGAAGRLGPAGADLCGHRGCRPGRRGWSGCGGCWTPPRCMTRWRPWTPSRCCARRSGGCCAVAQPTLRPRCGRVPAAGRLRLDGQAVHRLGGCRPAGGVAPYPRHRRHRHPGPPGRPRSRPSLVAQAAVLLAGVVGQDLEEGADGVVRIARKVAADRIISTVDPQARHGHKTAARGFDGYKAHVAVDPDAELTPQPRSPRATAGMPRSPSGCWVTCWTARTPDPSPSPSPPGNKWSTAMRPTALANCCSAWTTPRSTAMVKVQPPPAVSGHFPKDRFVIDLAGQTVTCPAAVTVAIRPTISQRHLGQAAFGPACAVCSLASQCTSAKRGRTITIGPHEALLAAARTRQAEPAWLADYRATRPKVERNSAISCAAATAAAVPACAAGPRLPRTSACWLPRSTSPGWACSACAGRRLQDGRWYERPRCAAPAVPPRPASKPGRSAGHHRAAQAPTISHPHDQHPFHTSHLVGLCQVCS